MGDITKPLPMLDIPVRPEPKALTRISDDMTQTLATIMGYDGSGRRLLRCSAQGALFVTNPPARAITRITAAGANYNWQGDQIPINEVMLRASPKNTSDAYVKLDEAADADNSWILEPGDVLTLTLGWLSRLHIKIVDDAEEVFIIYN